MPKPAECFDRPQLLNQQPVFNNRFVLNSF